MRKVKAAVFASGSGSNFEAIATAENLPCDIVLLVCDQPGAGVVARAERLGIPAYVITRDVFASKAAYELDLVNKLREVNVEWIFLAGYMRLIGPDLLAVYDQKIINIHPSRLPAFPGKDGIGDAYRAGVKTTGVTVHYVDSGVDTGPIIAQEPVEILPDDTIETLAARIHQVEHQLYPDAIRRIIPGT